MPWDKTPADRRQDAQRYGPAWRKARAAALARANHRCELRLEGCTVKATQVDHILGAANDPHHTQLRAVCASCHGKVTAQQGGGWRTTAPSDPASAQPPSDPQAKPSTTW